MDFSENERTLINRASRKTEPNSIVQIFVLITLFIGMCTFLLGLIEIQHFTYLSYFITLVLIITILSRSRRPTYKELVDLLVSKSNTNHD
ncbi:MAG: hypothetical protein KUG78_16070 [Kangiellaceae bacterium]|nr:hypothetical protein [Kangiellaceae bacterium]